MLAGAIFTTLVVLATASLSSGQNAYRMSNPRYSTSRYHGSGYRRYPSNMRRYPFHSNSRHDVFGLIQQVDDLEQRIVNLRVEADKKNQKIHEQGIALEHEKRKLQEASQLGCEWVSLRSLQNHAGPEQLRQLVEEFQSSMDWQALRSGLQELLLPDSTAARQLQELTRLGVAGKVWYMGQLGLVELSMLLLCNGFPMDTETRPQGGLMLHGAAAGGQLLMSKMLLFFGVDVNHKLPSDGRTPLMCAAVNGSLGVAKLLLDRGADVNDQMSDGRTALMIATYKNNLELVQLLVEAGADVGLQLADGKTALDAARERGHASIVSYLKSLQNTFAK